MNESNKDDFKLFKINKTKPLQFKRNLLIEKYVENYLTDQSKVKSTNVSRKSINPSKEENKTNYFIKKKPISHKKILLQDAEDTESTTLISNYFNKSINNRNKSNYPSKARTMSCTTIPKNNFNNIVLHKKNAGKSFSLRSKSNINSYHSHNKKDFDSNIQRNRNINLDFFKEYGKASQTQNIINNSFINNYEMKKNIPSQIFRNNIKLSNQRILNRKNNKFYSNNSMNGTLGGTIGGFNIIKTLKEINTSDITKTKIHKEINIEDFLLIEKKFEQIKNMLLNLINKNKSIENNKCDEINRSDLFPCCNFYIYDLYKFFLNSSIEGSPENLFSSSKIKIILHEYSIIFIISLATIYVENLFNNHNIYLNKNHILINIQQKIFLLLCDAILKRLNSKYNNNIWIKKLSEELSNKLIFNISDNFSQIKLLTQNSYKLINEIIESIHKYIIVNNNVNKNLEKINMFLYLYNNFFKKNISNFNHIKINEIEDLFNKNIFKIGEFQNKDILNNFNSINNNEYFKENQYNYIDTKPPFLKFPSRKEYTLILDLDETMICFKCSQEQKNVGNIHIRPGLEIFLEIIKEFYEVIIFTVGTRDYANLILDLIEKKNNTKYFDGRLYREHATKIGNKYIKDLSKIGRDLSKILIVDNNPHSFKFQHENGILINSYYGEKNNDKTLIELQKILIKIYNEKEDIRDSISKYKEEIIQKISFPNETE